MAFQYYVRCGPLSEVLMANGPDGLSRRTDVVMRTDRGVEIGQIVRRVDPSGDDSAPKPQPRFASAVIARAVTGEDRWLLKQLHKRRDEAVRLCQEALAEADFDGVLLDIDQQFDGGTLVLHFMGSGQLGRQITRPIVQQYESIVRSSKLAARLIEGCGPNCGTSESQCKGSCSGCAVSDSCSTSSYSSSSVPSEPE